MRDVVCALAMLVFCGAVIAADEGAPIFDGKSLAGWKQLGGAADYKVIDGAIVGSSRPGVANSFLVTEKDYGDFILEFDVRQDVGPTNSGVQFRSLSTPAFENGRVHGYQTDIDPSERQWSGGIYEEAQRGWFYTGEMNPPSKALYKFGEWNHYRVEAIGPRMRVWINDGPAADVIDDATRKGFFGLQVHSINNPEEAGRITSWKNLRVQTKKLKRMPPMGIFIRNNLPNNLDPEEKAQGWRLLWDGKTTHGWRGADAAAFPAKGWSFADGELAVAPQGGGGDIMTDEEFGAFELQMEFKVSAGANSGIFYLLTSPHDPASGAPLGLEYQILDDERHPDAKVGPHRQTAAFYDVLQANDRPLKPAGEWNTTRIVVRGQTVEHWLNGKKVLQYELNSPALNAAIEKSKFKGMERFGKRQNGYILLQDHGNQVWFRSIKIRRLA